MPDLIEITAHSGMKTTLQVATGDPSPVPPRAEIVKMIQDDIEKFMAGKPSIVGRVLEGK